MPSTDLAHPNDAATSLWLPAQSLWRREIVRFLRQRSRIIGALGTPIVFWLLLGSGLGRSFRDVKLPEAAAGMEYLEFSFPGMMVLIVLFTAVFSMISIIEDRREGFMQAVLAAPVRRSAVVLGKLLGSTTLALGQAVVFLAFAPVAGIPLSPASVAAVVLVLILLGMALGGVGFCIAWSMDSTQGFHAIMNLFLIPMWLLSGAMFPVSGAYGWLAWIMALNPLTYGVTALRHALYWTDEPAAGLWPSMAVCLGITAGFAVLVNGLAVRIVEKDG